MPDWFYRTVAQPALFKLPELASRRVALGVIGTLGRFRLGGALIDFWATWKPIRGWRFRNGAFVSLHLSVWGGRWILKGLPPRDWPVSE